MKEILVVVGTRPEAIKMAPLIRRLRAAPGIDARLCITGQHRDMVSDVLDLFGIEPDADLMAMSADQSLAGLTCRILSGLDRLLGERRPDLVLVHGDTTTTLSAAMAAYYRKIPVGHVEAGLRTRDMYAPWPEELNRKLTDCIGAMLFAPTASARANLLAEGCPEDRIWVTGNTVIDALLDIVNGPLQAPETKEALLERHSYLERSKKTVLVTCHRRESYGEGFRSVCAALELLSQRPDVQILFPIHMNPNVRRAFAGLSGRQRVHVIEPANYLDFVFLLSDCYLVLTDSGGIQEEAPSLGKPVLVMREVTERPEAVAAGTVKLVGTDPGEILSSATALLDNEHLYAEMSAKHNPYGDGKASERIIAALGDDFDRLRETEAAAPRVCQ